MDAAAPKGASPRRINFLTTKTVICPAVPHSFGIRRLEVLTNFSISWF
jgi:hypothetical protein